MLIYFSCELAIVTVTRVEDNLTLLFLDYLAFTVHVSFSFILFFLDALSMKFATPRYRFWFLFYLLFASAYEAYEILTKELEGNFQISIFNQYTLDIQSIIRATFPTIVTFILKNTVLCVMYPNQFVMLTTSLRHANDVPSGICCTKTF
jgi:hypothetical protein